jgi:hypothetical protein
MVSKERLPGYVHDIHSALIDISFENIAVSSVLDTPQMQSSLLSSLAPAPRPVAIVEKRTPSSESIKQAVDKLLNLSTTEVQPKVPHQVRVPPSAPKPDPAPRPKMIESTSVPVSVRAAEIPVQPAPRVEPSAKPSAPWAGEERRSRPIKAKPRVIIDTLLPPKLSSIEEALATDYIVCLEDGKKVKDLGEHLARINVTQDAYRAKWGLHPEYPMMAPSLIEKRAQVYEIDLVTGKVSKSR